MSDVPDIKLHNVSGSQQSGGASNHSNSMQYRKSIVQDINDSYSSFFSQCTQEENENNVDVMWDWYSPQSKPRVRQFKRSDIQQSPKLPIKRQSSNNQISGLNKLREELETLRDHIVESTDTGAVSNIKHTETKFNINAEDLEDVFNDSMEEQLLVCSQEAEYRCINGKPTSKSQSLEYLGTTIHSQEHVEKDLFNKTSVIKVMTNNNNEVNETFSTCNSSNKNNTKNNVTSNCLKDNMSKIADDSFDFVLETLKDEDLEFSKPFIITNEKSIETSCTNIRNNVQFAVKASLSIHAQDNSPKCTAQEIEQKRKEALSKLQVKKQIADEVAAPKRSAQEIGQTRKEAFSKLQAKQKEATYESESPIKCSPEEIEQKRLQAIEKLEAKKKQDIIERNRQQALKRLEENKRKRALQEQTSLPRKIHNANI